MDRLHNKQNFEKFRNSKIHYYSIKEHLNLVKWQSLVVKCCFKFLLLSNFCCRVLARQHTILDLIWILQTSLDPVFSAELCIVDQNLDLFLSVRPDFVIPGECRNLQVILENDGVRSNNILCCARMSLLHQYGFLHFWMQTNGHE